MAANELDAARKREAIVNLLGELDVSRVSTAEDASRLPPGEEFVDLDHLDRGIQKVSAGMPASPHTTVPKSAVSPATWKKIGDLLSA